MNANICAMDAKMSYEANGYQGLHWNKGTAQRIRAPERKPWMVRVDVPSRIGFDTLSRMFDAESARRLFRVRHLAPSEQLDQRSDAQDAR